MSGIELEERLRQFAQAETTDDAEAEALARLRLFLSRREYLAPASAPSGRRVLGIIGGASLIAAAGTAGVIAISKHGGNTALAPQPAVSPSPPVTSSPPATPPPTSTPAPTPNQVPLAVYPAIDQLVMVNFNEGWAVAHGKVVRTSDGARTWSDVTPPGLTVPQFVTNPSADVQVAAVDGDRAWVYDNPTNGATGPGDAYVYRTLDGGRSWARSTVLRGATTDAANTWGPLQMVSPQVGFLLIGRGCGAGSCADAVFQTTDGGASWTLMSETDPAVSGDPYAAPVRGIPLQGVKTGPGFRDAQTGWVTGSSGGQARVYETRDGGARWQGVRLPLPVGSSPSDQLEDVQPPRFLTARDGYLNATVAGDQQTGALRLAAYVTHDGGATWTGRFLPPGGGAQPLGGGRGVALGKNSGGQGVLYTTTDDWITFSTTPHPDPQPLPTEPHFVSLQYGWLLVTDNINTGATSVWVTHDSGATFTRLGP